MWRLLPRISSFPQQGSRTLFDRNSRLLIALWASHPDLPARLCRRATHALPCLLLSVTPSPQKCNHRHSPFSRSTNPFLRLLAGRLFARRGCWWSPARLSMPCLTPACRLTSFFPVFLPHSSGGAVLPRLCPGRLAFRVSRRWSAGPSASCISHRSFARTV